MHTPLRILILSVTLASTSVWVSASPQDGQSKPDNTKINKRDTNSGEATADNQKMNPDDTKLTAKIRRAVIADKTLSTYGHNVKIIAQNGKVTLKGPVQTEDERRNIVAKATEIAGGPDNVFNQLEVKKQ